MAHHTEMVGWCLFTALFVGGQFNIVIIIILLRSYQEYKTNELIYTAVGPVLVGRQELLLSTVKRRKLSWFDHVCRHKTLHNTMLLGTEEGA